MFILTAAFILGMLALLWLADDDWLDEQAERIWISYLADQSKRRKRRARCRYSRSAWPQNK